MSPLFDTLLNAFEMSKNISTVCLSLLAKFPSEESEIIRTSFYFFLSKCHYLLVDWSINQVRWYKIDLIYSDGRFKKKIARHLHKEKLIFVLKNFLMILPEVNGFKTLLSNLCLLIEFLTICFELASNSDSLHWYFYVLDNS
jgi:hypothetical protein